MNFFKVVREKDGKLISAANGLNPKLHLEYEVGKRTEAKKEFYEKGLGIFVFHTDQIYIPKEFMKTEHAHRIYTCSVEEAKIGVVQAFNYFVFDSYDTDLLDLSKARIHFYPECKTIAICKAITLLERVL